MTLVLLILAVIWAAVLIPPFLRARAEGRPADSITAFHRQLSVLRRTGPRLGGGGHSNPGLSSSPLAPVMPITAAPTAAFSPRLVPSMSRSAMARRAARRRRRDVLLALLVAAGTTLVLGAIPALRMLWMVHIAADVLLLGYVALLVRQRTLATERDLKVRMLPSARRHEARREVEGRWVDHEQGWLGPEPALLRRSAN